MASKQSDPAVKTDKNQKEAALDPSKVPEEQQKDMEARRTALPVRGSPDEPAPEPQQMEKVEPTPQPEVKAQDRDENIPYAEKQGEGNMFALDYTTTRLTEDPNQKGPKPSKEAPEVKEPTPQDEAASAVEFNTYERPKYVETADAICKMLYAHAKENDLSFAWCTHALDLARRNLGKFWVSQKDK